MSTFRAVYKDARGQTFSAPVEKRGDDWIMLTSEGPTPIAHHFDDDIGGRLTFVRYEEVEPDHRPLHIEAKSPGQSSLSQLQTAAAQREADYRRDREIARQRFLNEANAPNPHAVQQARDINNQFVQRRRWHT